MDTFSSVLDLKDDQEEENGAVSVHHASVFGVGTATSEESKDQDEDADGDQDDEGRIGPLESTIEPLHPALKEIVASNVGRRPTFNRLTISTPPKMTMATPKKKMMALKMKVRNFMMLAQVDSILDSYVQRLCLEEQEVLDCYCQQFGEALQGTT